jgi:hypothetical protein
MKSCHDLTVDMKVSQGNLCAKGRTQTTSLSPESIGKLDGVIANGKTTISKTANRFTRELNVVLLMRSAGNVREQRPKHALFRILQ